MELRVHVGTENKGKFDKDGKSLEITYDRTVILDFQPPTTIEEKIEAWGADVCNELCNRAGVISGRNQVTNWIRAEKSDGDIEKEFASWTPPLGATRSKLSKLEKAKQAVSGMTADEVKDLMKELKSLQG